LASETSGDQVAQSFGLAHTCYVGGCQPVTIPAQQLENKRKEKITPFGINVMSSQVLYWAAQGAQQLPLQM